MRSPSLDPETPVPTLAPLNDDTPTVAGTPSTLGRLLQEGEVRFPRVCGFLAFSNAAAQSPARWSPAAPLFSSPARKEVDKVRRFLKPAGLFFIPYFADFGCGRGG